MSNPAKRMDQLDELHMHVTQAQTREKVPRKRGQFQTAGSWRRRIPMARSDPPRLQSLLDWFAGIMSLWPSVPAKLGKSERLSMDKTSAGIFLSSQHLSVPSLAFTTA